MSVITAGSAHTRHMEDRTFKRSIMVSTVIHVLVLVVAGSMTLFRMNGITYSPSYTVDLVTLPGPPATSSPAPKASAPAPTAKPVKPTPPVAKPEPKPEPAKPAVTTPTRPVEKAETVKPTGGDEAARVERRRRIEELEQEARRLYDSFTTETDSSAGPVTGSSEQTETEAVQPSGGRGGSTADLRFRAYYDQIWGMIRSSWVLPEGVATEGKLLTVVGIRIASSGEIEQFWIEKKSGNEYYDQSALRAIRKSNPLPALPRDLGNEPLEVGVNFRYPE